MPKNKLTILLLTAACLSACFHGMAADYAPSSILSSGQWVKMHVDSTSIYRIDHTSLREHGFADPSKVRIYGYGSVEQAHTLDTAPDDLPAIPVWHSGDAMYFYAEGDIRVTPQTSSSLTCHKNYYSRGSDYFLTDSHPGLTISEADVETQTNSTVTHTCIDLRQPEQCNFKSAGVFFFSRDLPSLRGSLDFTFSAPDFSNEGYLAYRYAYLHDEDSALGVDVKLSGSVTNATFIPTTHKANVVDNRIYSLSALKKITLTSASAEPFSISFSLSSGQKFKHLALSEVYLMYSRLNRLDRPVMLMDFTRRSSTPTPFGVTFSDLPDAAVVWDVSSPRQATSLKVNFDADKTAGVTIPAHEGVTSLRLCAFIPGTEIPQPKFTETEISCRDLHAMPGADYLIIAPRAFMAEAERLAAAHRQMQGLEVAVVAQDEVFNEFSSGASHPNAIRKFVRMLHKRPGHPLRYLLLLGASTFDPRHLMSDSGIDYLAGYQVERTDHASSAATNYATDLYFGLMADRIPENIAASYTEIPIAIGRAPVITADEAKVFVDKSIAYLEDPRLAGRPDLAALICCEGDKDAHLKSSERMRSDIIRMTPSATCARIYNALYPFDKKVERRPTLKPLAAQLARGPFLLNYTGHSGAFEIGAVMSVANLDGLQFGSMPVAYFSSCETTPADNDFRGLGTELLLHPKGPVAVIGTGRDVFLSYNQALNEEFVRQLVARNGQPRLGDVWLQAINTTNQRNQGQRINNFCYNFLADPALPVRRPDRKVSLLSCNGKATGGKALSAPSLSPLKLSGLITTADGSADTDFNGTINVTINEAPHTMQRYVHASGDSDTIMSIDESILLESMAEVRNGKWEIDLTPPLTSRQGGGRLTYLAYSDNGHIACGLDTLSVTNPTEGLSADTTAPEIELYINSPGFTDGAAVGPSPVLHALITDSGSGVSNSNAAIGSLPKAVIDGSTQLRNLGDMLQLKSDGSACLTYPLKNLGEGRHEISLSARDVAGNTARKSITFTVINQALTAALTADSSIVRNCVELRLSHSIATSPRCRLIIRDSEGTTHVSRQDASFPFTWDFRSDDGSELPDGTYRASVLLSDGLRSGSAPEVEFTLIRPKY